MRQSQTCAYIILQIETAVSAGRKLGTDTGTKLKIQADLTQPVAALPWTSLVGSTMLAAHGHSSSPVISTMTSVSSLVKFGERRGRTTLSRSDAVEPFPLGRLLRVQLGRAARWHTPLGMVLPFTL